MFIATLESAINTMVQQDRIVKLETELEQLKAAVQDNRIVEQATGAISVRYRMSPNEAVEMLREGRQVSGATFVNSPRRSPPMAGVSPGPEVPRGAGFASGR